jgi:hypothetical protein
MAQNTAEAWPDEGGQDASLMLRDRLAAIVSGLDKEACRRVTERNLIEQRWLEDLRQYHGKYDETTAKNLSGGSKSSLFINATRPKTNAMAARMIDMLFPTDDRNWGIQPTPVPDLVEEAGLAAAEAAKKMAVLTQMEAEQDPNLEQARGLAQEDIDLADTLQAELDEARDRAAAMEAEIFDQLKECQYQAQARDAIEDACKIGTGIMKGPVLGGRAKRQWRPGEGNVYELGAVTDPKPQLIRVDPWAFFPDTDARSVEDSEGIFERHLMREKELRKLARQPGFDPDAVRRLLKEQPTQTAPSYLSDLRSITGEKTTTLSDRYIVWEYHGPVKAEDLRDLALAMDKPDVIADAGEDIDPLTEINVCLWFCQTEVLKFGISPLDSGEPIYSAFCIEKDEASLFGYGVPYIMRDSQRALNGAWRMLMDNAGLSTGPQIVMGADVEPVDGDWTLVPRKLWKRKAGSTGHAFETYNIDSHQAELTGIIQTAMKLIDDETAMPALAQGEQGSGVTKTAQGMALLMNSANVVFRRIVKNFDDDMTTPNIRRMYDWNMQYSSKEYIKGDYEVDARGSSVLLDREMQAQNLMQLALHFAQHPVFGPMMKGSKLFRKIVSTHRIQADEIVKSDNEIEAEAARAAAQQGEGGDGLDEIRLEMARAELEAKVEIANLDAQVRREVAQMNRDTAMMSLAEKHNMTLDQLEAKLQMADADRQSKERVVAVEASMAERLGKGGGGHI